MAGKDVEYAKTEDSRASLASLASFDFGHLIQSSTICRMPFVKFSFRPSSKGVAQVLGELESAVIKLVWQNPDCTAREVLERLADQRQLAYTTVVTVLDRLHKKGFLKRRLDGRAFLYRPGITQTEFDASVTRDVLEGLLKEGSRPTLSTFVDLVAADEDLLKELEELIEQRRP